MTRYTITAEKLRAMLRAAYEDGFEDGADQGDPNAEPREGDWNRSVTKDNLDQDLTKARDRGGFLG